MHTSAPHIQSVWVGGTSVTPGQPMLMQPPQQTIDVEGIAYGDSDAQTPIDVQAFISGLGSGGLMQDTPAQVTYTPGANAYDRAFRARWLNYSLVGDGQTITVRQIMPGTNSVTLQSLNVRV